MVDTVPASGSRGDRRRKTERRILDEASRLFAARGYERTTIRAIARVAGVDPGLVIHYFGSKQHLFWQVTDASPTPELVGTPDEVVEQILGRLADSLANEPVQSLALLRSMLTHPEAADAATHGFARFRDEITRSIPGADTKVRAELISAIVLGVIVSRHLLKSDGYAEASPGQVTELLRPCLRSLAGEDAPPRPTMRAGTRA